MADVVGSPRSYVLTRGYDLQLVIKNRDFTPEIFSIRIVSSISAPYQVVTIDLFVNPELILKEEIFSKDPLKLSIRFEGHAEEKFLIDQQDMDLMYLKTVHRVVPQVQRGSQNSQKDRSIVRIITVPRKPFKTITTLVNDVYIGKTVRDIIQDLVTKTDATLSFTATGANSEPIDQVVIPPTTLYKAIVYLDETFGIFDGMAEIHCALNNEMQVHNLSTEINKDQTFGIYQLPLDITTNDFREIAGLCMDGKNFYTYSPLKSEMASNSKFSFLAKQTKHIVKPKDSLYSIIDKDLDEVTSDYSISYRSDKVSTDSVTNRIKYYTDHLGYQENQTFINARLAKNLSNISTVSLSIEKNLKALKLLNVGEPVKLITKTPEYTNIDGKYILRSSDINFTKAGEWFPTCNIVLFRTTNTVGQR